MDDAVEIASVFSNRPKETVYIHRTLYLIENERVGSSRQDTFAY